MMETHIENTISIPELAASVGLSRRQLERLFMEKTKSSPALVYKRVRLERAKQLLLETSVPMVEIAIEVGFENASHFSRAFARRSACRPARSGR